MTDIYLYTCYPLKILFIKNESNYSAYWMSSRCVDDNSRSADFYEHGVNFGCLYSSSDYTFSLRYALRPVVTLNSNVLVKLGEGTPESAYEI